MSAASLHTRLSKLHSVDDGLTLDQWKVKAARNLPVTPRHILVSIVVGRLVVPHVADALEQNPVYRAWLDVLSADGADDSFDQFCLRQGTSIDRVLSDARKSKEH